MTDKTEAQPEALRVAAWLINAPFKTTHGDMLVGGRELRRLYAETEAQAARIAELEAQLSARQDAPNPWQQAIDHELVCLHLGVAEDTTQESAAKALRELIQCHVEIAINPQTNGGLTLQPHGTPPPPEREPLTDEQILQLFIEMYGQEPVDITEFAEVCGRVEKQHGIGATND